MMLRIARAARREEGTALISAIVISGIIATLGLTAITVAVHTNQVSGLDRSRTQSVHAADAAISEMTQRFATDFNNSGTCSAAGSTTASAPVRLTDGGSRIARYRYRVEPVPGDPGYPNSCTTNQRMIRSWGYAESGKGVRQLEAAVTVTPIQGFNYTLFAGGNPGTLEIKNSATVSGNVYAQALDSVENNLNMTAGDLTSPGTVFTKNNASYAGNIIAGNGITLGTNNNIAGFVRSANAGYGVTIGSNTSVSKTITSGGTISPTPCPAPNVCTANAPSQPPASIPLPTFVYDPANYATPPPGPVNFTSVSVANTFFGLPVGTGLTGTFYVTDPLGGTLELTAPWKIVGPLTIIADRCPTCAAAPKIKISGSWTSTCSASCQFVVISMNSAASPCTVPSPCAITISNPQLTFPSNLSALLYTPGGVDVSYQVNAMVGSIYSSAIDAKNNLSIQSSSDLANSPPPGFTFPAASITQWHVVTNVWREVAPGTLPPGSL